MSARSCVALSPLDAPGAGGGRACLAGVNAWNDFLGPLIYLQT